MDAIVDEDILVCLVSNALLVSMIYVTRHIGALCGCFFCSRERTGHSGARQWKIFVQVTTTLWSLGALYAGECLDWALTLLFVRGEREKAEAIYRKKNIFSIFFYSYEEKHKSKATTQKYTKSYHIIYSLCRSTHLESNTIGFSILWFFCDLL